MTLTCLALVVAQVGCRVVHKEKLTIPPDMRLRRASLPSTSASGRTGGDLFGQVPAPESVRWPRQQSARACSPTMRWAQTLERPCLCLRFLQSLAPPSSPAGPLVYSQLGQWRGIGCSVLQKALQNHPIHPYSLPHRPTAGRHAVADPGRAQTFAAPDRRAAN